LDIGRVCVLLFEGARRTGKRFVLGLVRCMTGVLADSDTRADLELERLELVILGTLASRPLVT